MSSRVAATYHRLSLVVILGAISLVVIVGFGIGSGKVGFGSSLLGFGVVGAMLTLMALPAPRARVLLLGGTLLLLTFFPVARVVIGSNIPIYFVDILIAFLLLLILLQKDRIELGWSTAQPLPRLLMLFWLPITFLSFVNEVRITDILLEPLYMLIRTLLSISVFFVISALVRSRRSLYLILWCLALGMAITASLSILNSLLPLDSPILTMLDNLSPMSLDKYQARYLGSGNPIRARALIGGPNQLGALVALLWSLPFGLHVSGKFRRANSLLTLMLIVGVFGVVTTYSRSAYLGIGLALAMLALKHTRGRWLLLPSIILISLFLLMWGETIGVVQLDFIFAKFATLQDPMALEGNRARIEAYSNMPGFLVAHPLWFITGRGLATYDLLLRGLTTAETALSATQNHSYLIITFYQRGLIAMILVGLIWIVSFRLMSKQRTREGATSRENDEWLRASMQASLISLLPTWLFDHFFNSQVHMQTVLFAFFGLIIVVHRLRYQGQRKQPTYHRSSYARAYRSNFTKSIPAKRTHEGSL